MYTYSPGKQFLIFITYPKVNKARCSVILILITNHCTFYVILHLKIHLSVLWGCWLLTEADHLPCWSALTVEEAGVTFHRTRIWEWDWGRGADEGREGNGESLEPSKQLSPRAGVIPGWAVYWLKPAEPLCFDTIQEREKRGRIKKIYFWKLPSYFTILFNSFPTYSYFHLTKKKSWEDNTATTCF